MNYLLFHEVDHFLCYRGGGGLRNWPTIQVFDSKKDVLLSGGGPGQRSRKIHTVRIQKRSHTEAKSGLVLWDQIGFLTAVTIANIVVDIPMDGGPPISTQDEPLRRFQVPITYFVITGPEILLRA